MSIISESCRKEISSSHEYCTQIIAYVRKIDSETTLERERDEQATNTCPSLNIPPSMRCARALMIQLQKAKQVEDARLT